MFSSGFAPGRAGELLTIAGSPDWDEAPALASTPPPSQHQVLAEPLFKSALLRERKRADRFDQVFVLLTVAVGESAVESVVAAFGAAARYTDILGWLKQGSVLGLIAAEQRVTSTDEIAHRIEGRIQQELERRVAANAVGALGIRVYVHENPRDHGAAGLVDADPLLEHLRLVRERRRVLDALKRTLDVVSSLMLLVLLSPVFLIVAALVKLTSPGPVLFRQERIGFMATPFTMLKFRTMQAKVDPRLHRQFVTDFIKATGPQSQAREVRRIFKIEHDPRVTPIGRLLRRTSLDELPQLWNVLRGEMTLVGPRPPLRYELEHYRSWHWRRVLEARPGVTGLWQVKGRSRTTFDEMVRLDLHYVRTRSLWTDVKILLETPRAVISGRGAC